MIDCAVEHTIPIPTYAQEYFSIRERAKAACETANLLRQNGATFPNVDVNAVNTLVKESAAGLESTVKQHAVLANPANAIRVKEILTEYDTQIVTSADQIRRYVTNKLIVESDGKDAKVRIQALKLLGQISDVGLFTERTEVTIKDKSNKDLEELLRTKLEQMKQKVIDVQARVLEQPSLDADEVFEAADINADD